MSNVISLKTTKRFFEKVRKGKHPDDCWEWLTSKTFQGYGKFSYKGMLGGAHRMSWRIEYGEIPGKLCVLHHCDNPECCNPKHLFLGTRGDNVRDAIKKGRRARLVGEQTGSSKLTEKEVLEIRQIYKDELMSQNELARKYRVTQANIWFILHRKSWTHI